MVISGSRMALDFNPKWVVHASRVFIPTSSLQFSWFFFSCTQANILCGQTSPSSLLLRSNFFVVEFAKCPSPTQLSVEILWCEANMCKGWDHSRHKTAHIFQQIVSGWKNAFSRIGLENSIFPPVNGLYACPYIFIS